MKLPGFYVRFEEWVQAQSRGRSALLVGAGSAIGVFLVTPLFNDIGIRHAVSSGVMMTVVYYALEPVD